MADNLGREAIPGVAGASGCPHPTQLPIPIRWRNRGKARQVDGALEIAERVRTVAKLLEGLGHHVEEIADASICDWETLWSAYCANWVGSRAQFATMAKDRGVSPERLQEHLGPMVHRHYLAAERYDKFDIWKMMVCNNAVTREFGRLMERFDALLVPTTAVRVPEANGPYSLLRD